MSQQIVYRRPDMYKKQRDAFFNDKKITVCEATTKAGKTIGCVFRIVEEALTHPNQDYVWIAPVYSQAKIGLEECIKLLFKQFGNRTVTINDKNVPIFRQNQNPLPMIHLCNGSRIKFISAEYPSRIWGGKAYGVIMDEASRFKNSIEVWDVVQSITSATNAWIIMIGNVRDTGGWFYHQAREAEKELEKLKEKSTKQYVKITIWHAIRAHKFTGIEASKIHAIKKTVSQAEYLRTYWAIASDGFGNPFGGATLINTNIEDVTNKKAIVYGIDFGLKIDYTVIIGLDVDCKVCYFKRQNIENGIGWGNIYDDIVSICGDVIVNADATGEGDPICEHLESKGVNIERFIFTNRSKQDLLEKLRKAIATHLIRYPKGEIVNELIDFEIKPMLSSTKTRYGARFGKHDDCVMALGLAYYLFEKISNMSTGIYY